MTEASTNSSSYRTKSISFTHYWTIENYAWYCGPRSGYNRGKLLESELFSIPPDVQERLPANIAASQYKASIFPKGDNIVEKEQNYSSIYINTTAASPAQTLMIEYAIVDADGKVQTGNQPNIRTLFKMCKKYESGASWGFCRWMPNEGLLKTENRYLSPEGHLTIRFCIAFVISLEQIEQNTKEELEHFNKVFGQQQLCVNMTDLWKMRSEFSDLTLEVSRSKVEVPANKAILVARSSVFAAMFRNKECKESLEYRICIPDMSVQVCEALLEYLYTGAVESLEKKAEKLLPFADKYQIVHLKLLCEDQLCTQITTKTVNRFLSFSEHHNAAKLREKSFDFIKKRALESITTLLETPNKVAKVDQMISKLLDNDKL